MTEKKGFITKLAGAIDSILPSNNSSNATSSQLSKRQREQKYGEWTDLVTVVLYTIEGIKAQDANFLIADKPTYITKFIFYPQDTASKNHLLKILGSNGYSNDSTDDNIYDGEDYRYQFRRMAADTGYHNLDIAPDMLIEISDEELIGDGSISNIINAGLLDYTHNLASERYDESLYSKNLNDDNELEVGQVNTKLNNQIEEINHQNEYNLNRVIDSSSIQLLEKEIEADIKETFNEVGKKETSSKNVNKSINIRITDSTSNQNNNETTISLKCSIHDANGNRNQTISKFPCKVGKSGINDIIVNGKFVSREHLTISHIAGQFFIQDRSSNHSFLSNQLHNVEEVLASSDTALLTGKTELLLGGQSSHFDEHPKLIFEIEQATTENSIAKKMALLTPLNVTSEDNYLTNNLHNYQDGFLNSNLNQNNKENNDDSIDILSTRASQPIEQKNQIDMEKKLGGVTKLAPLFKLTISTANVEQTYEVDRLPWSIGRVGTNSVININEGIQTTISRQHITITKYDDLEQNIIAKVDGRNGASITDVTTGQVKKYRHGDSMCFSPGQIVRVGIDRPAVTFKISVDDDCL